MPKKREAVNGKKRKIRNPYYMRKWLIWVNFPIIAAHLYATIEGKSFRCKRCSSDLGVRIGEFT